MFEQHIAETKQLINQKTIGADQRIVFRTMLACDIPQSVKQFFRMDIGGWLQEERARLLNSPHFDYTDADVIARFDDIIASAEAHAAFTREEFDAAVDKAIKLLFNYVCHPQWTLTKFIYADNEHAHVEDILSLMTYFTDYPYYRNIFDEFFRSKNYLHFKKDKFEELLVMIDREVVKDYDAREMALITQPIFDLFNIVPALDEPRVPVEALTVFYEDKDLKAIVDELDAIKERTDTMSMLELIDFLDGIDFSMGLDISKIVSHHKYDRSIAEEDVQFGGEQTVALGYDDLPDRPIFIEPEGPDTTAVEMPLTDIPHVFPGAHYDDALPEIRLTDDEELPPVMLTADEETPAIEHPIASSDEVFSIDTLLATPEEFNEIRLHDTETIEPEKVSPLKFIEHEHELPGISDAPPMSLQDDIALLHEKLNRAAMDDAPPAARAAAETLAPAAPAAESPVVDLTAVHDAATMPTNLEDLRVIIPAADKKKFVKKLFKRNDINYESAINDLNEKHTWRETSEKIDEIFVANNIDTYSKYALKFTEFIYKRFDTR